MLTQRQKQVLDYIRDYIKRKGYGPTLDEISKALRMGSASAAHQHVEILRQKGFLKKFPYQPRSISPYEESEETIEIPILGGIALGKPIERFQEPEALKVPRCLLCGSGDHYALVALGDSMKDDGILNGDILIIRHQNFTDNGDIVVALIEDRGATLKRFYDHGSKIELRPKNEEGEYKPMFLNKGEIEIQGKFCGLIRKGGG